MRPTRRVLIAVAVAVLLATGAGIAAHRMSTPDGPSRADLVAAIKQDPRTADVPGPAAECVADWYLTYATPEQIEALMTAGEAVSPPASEQAATAILECLKNAT